MMNYLVSVILYQFLQIASFSQTNKNYCVCYNFRNDSLTTHCLSSCVIGERLGNVGHVRRQDSKVCGDQTSVGRVFTSLHFQIRA